MASGSTSPQLYLIPCSCGEKVRVRARQAGEQVTCQCGAAVNVPTIRGLKQLETVVDEAEQPAPQRSAWQGPLFSLGLITVFVGAILLTMSWLFPPANLRFDWQHMALNEAEALRAQRPVSELGVSDLYDEFIMLRDRARDTPWDEARKSAEAAQAFQSSRQLAGGLLVGIGGLLAIIGLVIPTQSRR